MAPARFLLSANLRVSSAGNRWPFEMVRMQQVEDPNNERLAVAATTIVN